VFDVTELFIVFSKIIDAVQAEIGFVSVTGEAGLSAQRPPPLFKFPLRKCCGKSRLCWKNVKPLALQAKQKSAAGIA
jgi:hypothetical protein